MYSEKEVGIRGIYVTEIKIFTPEKHNKKTQRNTTNRHKLTQKFEI